MKPPLHLLPTLPTCWPTNVKRHLGLMGGKVLGCTWPVHPSSLSTPDLWSPLVPCSHVCAGINPWTTGVIIPNRMGLLNTGNTGADSAKAPVCFDQGASSYTPVGPQTEPQKRQEDKTKHTGSIDGEDAFCSTDNNAMWSARENPLPQTVSCFQDTCVSKPWSRNHHSFHLHVKKKSW